MRIQVLSDLHTEFNVPMQHGLREYVVKRCDYDVLVIAGDVGSRLHYHGWPVMPVVDKPVVYVLGNHEYYYSDINGLAKKIGKVLPEYVHLLDCAKFELDGVRFLGTTLWTDFLYGGRQNHAAAKEFAKSSINDFFLIRNGAGMFAPDDAVVLHKRSIGWLKKELAQTFDGKTVVVTHHLPLSTSVPLLYKKSSLNPSYASNLDYLFEDYAIDVWIHGHTHGSCKYRKGNTLVVCNPYGYFPHEINNDFDHCMLIDL